MKGNCDYQPPGILEYGKTGTGQVLFNIERNDKEIDGEMYENWDFDYAEIPSFKRDDIIAAVIRSRYSQYQSESIISNYQRGIEIDEYIEFQTWRKIAKAIANNEDYNELELYKQSTEEAVDNAAIKRLMRKVTEPILQDEANLTEQDIEDAKMLYPVWRGTGVNYVVGDKVRHKEGLYKIIQAHTSQADWAPDVAESLFVKFTPPGQIAAWEQPQGAHDAYKTGDKVTHNNNTWESTVNDNVWEPGVYGWSVVIT
jgi:hypothetical protein